MMNKMFAAVITLILGLGISANELVLFKQGEKIPYLSSSGTGADKTQEKVSAYFRKSTGVLPETGKVGKPEIHFEVRPAMKGDPESFCFEFPDTQTIVIASPTEWGLAHGANEFMERALGIRWLFPGELGEYVPSKTIVSISRTPVAMSPAFLMRVFAFDHSKNEQYEWARHNKANFGEVRTLPGRIWHGHNLYNLMSSDDVKNHPEYFPILKGKRFLPELKTKKENIFWQPCFTAPGLPEAMAQGVIRQRKETRESNISFGVNDGGHHCECSHCLAVDGNQFNRFGFRDRSKSYFQCMNQVAAMAAEPGCAFGICAYDAISEPPEGVKLHPSIRAALTYARLQWVDPVRRANDQQLIKRWHRATGGEVLMYDYFQMRDSVIPTIYCNLVAEYLRWGYANNVRHYYTEAYPNDSWISGPMLYIVLRLAWNPAIDYQAALREWYTCAVGPQAAPYLERYFTICSDYWEKKVQKTAWFQPERQYMMDGSFGYLEAFDFKQLDTMKKLLEKTVENSGGKDTRARAEFFLKGFLNYEKQVRRYQANRELEKKIDQLKFRTILSDHFEADKLYWNAWQRTAGKGKFALVKDDGRSGGAAMMNAENAFKDMVYMRNIPVTPGKVCRATVWVRMMGTAPESEVSLIMAWGAEGKPWLPSSSNVSKTLHDDMAFKWRKMTVFATVPDVKGVYLRLMLNLRKAEKGNVFWDDVVVEESENEPEKEKLK